jgi:uncharacterized C2H2 Zn-finger protein
MLKIVQKWIGFDHLAEMNSEKILFLNSLIYDDVTVYNENELKKIDNLSIDDIQNELINHLEFRKKKFNSKFETKAALEAPVPSPALLASPAPTKTNDHVPKRKSLFAEWDEGDNATPEVTPKKPEVKNNKPDKLTSGSESANSLSRLKQKKRLRSEQSPTGSQTGSDKKKQRIAGKALNFKELISKSSESDNELEDEQPPSLESAPFPVKHEFNETFTVRKALPVENDVTDFNDLVDKPETEPEVTKRTDQPEPEVTKVTDKPQPEVRMRTGSGFVRCSICNKRLSKDALEEHKQKAHNETNNKQKQTNNKPEVQTVENKGSEKEKEKEPEVQLDEPDREPEIAQNEPEVAQNQPEVQPDGPDREPEVESNSEEENEKEPESTGSNKSTGSNGSTIGLTVQNDELELYVKNFTIYIEKISDQTFKKYGFKKVRGQYRKNEDYVFNSDSESDDSSKSEKDDSRKSGRMRPASFIKKTKKENRKPNKAVTVISDSEDSDTDRQFQSKETKRIFRDKKNSNEKLGKSRGKSTRIRCISVT